MKAAVMLKTGEPLVIRDVELDVPGPSEIVVRTKAAGLCHSDLHILEGKGYAPTGPVLLGHEAVGIVEAVGTNVTSLKPGDHVATCLSIYCGECRHCLTGHMSLCMPPQSARAADEAPRLRLDGERLHQFSNIGAFAEKMLVHEHACARIDQDMDFGVAAILGCAVVTGLGAVWNSAQVRPGDTVAILGCGGVGLVAIQGAALAGARRIIAIDRLPSKLDMAKSFGATDVVDASQTDPVQAVKALTGGGVDYSFEVVGRPDTAQQAFSMLGKGGVATIVGVMPMGATIELNAMDFLMERKIQGSLMGSNRFPIDIPRFIELYRQGRLNLDSLISDRIPLEQINSGFEAMKEGRVARSVIIFD